MPDPRTPEVVQFGVFEANLATGELRRNGSKVRLQEQPFQVLALLLAQPGQIVTREELHARLWPANTFVDFDHGLNAAIKRLRDALGDSAENPRFVETLARRGYRFLAPVVPALPAKVNSDASANGANPPPTPAAYRRWRIALTIAAVLLIGISAGWHAGHRSAASIQTTERALTGNPQNDPVLGAAISPDGKYLAFSDRDGLFLRLPGNGETHPLGLADSFKTTQVAWFPDGGHVLLTRTSFSSDKPSLWSASVFGGAPTQLADNAERGVVSADGSKIVFLHGDYSSEKGGESGAAEIWQMQSDGQQAHKLFGQSGDKFESVAWSPDSRHIAFVRKQYLHGWDDQAEGSLGILDPSTGKTSYILSSSRLSGPLVWAADGRLIYSLGELPPNQTDSNLWAIYVNDRGNQTWGQPTRLTTGPDAKMSAGISADGRDLVFLRTAGAPAVYVAEIKDGGTAIGTPHRLGLDERRNIPFSWTADGKSVIFTSDRGGPFHAFKQSIDQPAPDLLVGGDQNIDGPRLSPNGSEILYILGPLPHSTDRRARIMRDPLSGGTPQLVLSEFAISGIQCARAPSSVCILSTASEKSIAYMTFDPLSGAKNDFIRIEDPEWYLYNYGLSPDGSTLAICKKHHPLEPASIRFLPIAGGSERTITLDRWSAITYMDWAADSRSLWVRAFSPEGTQTLLKVDTHGTARPVFQETEMLLGWAIPSPDGRHLAIEEASVSSNAWLLHRF